MQTIANRVLNRIRGSGADSVFSPNQFLDLGSRSAVGVVLHRLVKAKKIRRIRRGLYDLPRQHPIVGQTAPNIMATVRALMKGSQAKWQFTGAYAANALGLSDQVPAKIIIMTDGVPRKVSLGKLTLAFRRAAQLVGSRTARWTGDSSVALSSGQPGDAATCSAVAQGAGFKHEKRSAFAHARDAGVDAPSRRRNCAQIEHGHRPPTFTEATDRTVRADSATNGHGSRDCREGQPGDGTP